MGGTFDLEMCATLRKDAGIVVTPTRAGVVSKAKYRPTVVFVWENNRCANDDGAWCAACDKDEYLRAEDVWMDLEAPILVPGDAFNWGT